MDQKEVRQFIIDAFEENYELMRMEGGHAITGEAKQKALEQVLLYWEKLHELAERVTDTEILLTLPEQRTPAGRKYTIQGVVDIVEENGETVMYDVKTHDCDTVAGNPELYEVQLNIYAYIWQTLRRQSLDGAGIIATGQTEALKEAFRSNQEEKIIQAVEEWDPVITIPLDPDRVEATICRFGEVVDRIEDCKFHPPDWTKLKEPVTARKTLPFATHVCRNCDVRFSCRSYRTYAQNQTGKSGLKMEKFLDDYGNDEEQQEWMDGNLESDLDGLE
ncbi:PD-(D/E)XK nuclease family protein [Thermoactinomyces mirandus]|uniref:PD-(D/E)XK nuclease family protein n=1 Tax=Thermoactinomyces mirandus TaxID=2756294 RepID=A0A7W2ASE9_9BACL|nr:PD-(D/E)XK nuclease family protein [Thermoactinomyces mirandus]MBA4603548.1 PD-(D/E)XK nuclease family protein [Thermoactinomyces mirandus]